MARIRAVFLLLAVVLLVPMGLLVERALESVALERRVSHQAVAERLFDEMERQLSQFLRAEEERPFSDYELEDDEVAAADPIRAQAANAAPYVAGYFQIDPDGSYRGRSAPAGAVGEARDRTSGPDPKLKASVLRGLARPSEKPAAREAAMPSEEVADIDHFAAESAAVVEPGAADRGDPGARQRVSPYAALESLNRAARSRGDRQVKRALSKKRPARADEPAAAPRAAEIGALAMADVSEAEGAETAAAEQIGDARHGGPAPADPLLEVHPMVGRLIDAEQLLLSRTVLLGEQRFRQGLIVRLADLFRQLDGVVAGSPQLAPHVERNFFTPLSPEPSRAGGDAFEYVHRFAEPFDDLAVQLRLEPLPGVASASYLYAIAVLLLLSGPIGLLALYRMVAVTVRFAERRSNFVAAVSHELKTPLTSIRMHSEMLRDDMVPDEAKRREYYATITAESERLTRLINNVLEFSRLEQGTRELNLSVGELGPVVAGAAELLRTHAREAGFDLSVEIGDGLPPVRYDRDALLQVVFNLVDNALKYARDAGDRRIRIRCAREGEGVVVAVSDRGHGVAAQHLAHVFEPFYRGESELTRTAKGTGIGLALVQGLAESMGAAVIGRNLREGGFEVALRFRAVAAA